MREECLDWMLMFGRRHLIRVLGIYIEHYNRERPHRSRGLSPPLDPVESRDRPEAKASSIRRRDRLGGLLHEYCDYLCVTIEFLNPRADVAAQR
ncbi:MAG: transposase [Actinobacteria bacterium]|nr:transposase [Actinomycetota bacterium]